MKDVWIAGFGVFFWRFQGVAPTPSSLQNADVPGGSLGHPLSCGRLPCCRDWLQEFQSGESTPIPQPAAIQATRLSRDQAPATRMHDTMR